MILDEGYNLAVKKYGKQIADQIYRAGIPKTFVDTACRFYVEDGVPIEQLQDDWKKWNRYVLNNPSYKSQYNKNLNCFKTYLDFKRELERVMKPFICPNPIYDDGNLSIGECRTQRDARWFPMQNLAYPDDNNDFCVSKNSGGFQQFQKYKQLGYKMLIIYDKGRSANDEYKRMFVIARNGHLDFWNHFDRPCGTTKHKDDPIWNYIDSLPHDAQIALSRFAESTLQNNESKTNKNMKKNVVKINENTLRQIVAESVKKVLKENSSDTDSEIYQAITSFMDEIHRIITTDREAVEYYGEEIRDVQQSAIRLRDALIHPTQRRMGVSQGDLTYDYLS